MQKEDKSKKEEHEEEIKDPEVESTNNEEEQKSKKSELKNKIKDLEESIVNKDLEIYKMRSQIDSLNRDYISKIQLKAEEAQKLVNEKIKTFQDKYSNDAKDLKKYAIQNSAENLLEVLNNFERAIKSSANASKEVQNYVMGFSMILNQFRSILESEGVKEISVKIGDKFDHNIHHSVEVSHLDNLENDVVSEIYKKGYMIHDKVLVQADVKVNKK